MRSLPPGTAIYQKTQLPTVFMLLALAFNLSFADDSSAIAKSLIGKGINVFQSSLAATGSSWKRPTDDVVVEFDEGVKSVLVEMTVENFDDVSQEFVSVSLVNDSRGIQDSFKFWDLYRSSWTSQMIVEVELISQSFGLSSERYDFHINEIRKQFLDKLHCFNDSEQVVTMQFKASRPLSARFRGNVFASSSRVSDDFRNALIAASQSSLDQAYPTFTDLMKNYGTHVIRAVHLGNASLSFSAQRFNLNKASDFTSQEIQAISVTDSVVGYSLIRLDDLASILYPLDEGLSTGFDLTFFEEQFEKVFLLNQAIALGTWNSKYSVDCLNDVPDVDPPSTPSPTPTKSPTPNPDPTTRDSTGKAGSGKRVWPWTVTVLSLIVAFSASMIGLYRWQVGRPSGARARRSRWHAGVQYSSIN